MRALGLHDGIAGGRLRLEGRGERPGPGSPIQATLDVTDLTLLEAPMLAQILAGISISGWRNLLGDGVTFDRIWGDFRLEDSTVSTSSLRAVGGSLGLTAKGRVDVASGSLAVSGLVVPAYGLNEILGQIPLIGEILIGAEGEGLVAVSYDVKGTLGEPEVSINAASALAPGILRRLFGLDP